MAGSQFSDSSRLAGYSGLCRWQTESRIHAGPSVRDIRSHTLRA